MLHCRLNVLRQCCQIKLNRTMSSVHESRPDTALQQECEASIPFARARIGPFFQDPPTLGNQYTEDVTLMTYLKRFMPEEVFADVDKDLTKFGARVANEINALGWECEQNPPKLQQYNAWGRRVDEIITCPAWKNMKSIAAEEGLIATAYERKHAEFSRLHQMAKLYLFSPSSGLYNCPLAMTDGAAKSIEVLSKQPLLEDAFSHLTSRQPQQFWTSGQWMTERKGGSDVAGGTETLAVPQDDGTYRLHGYKWFTSATDADMTLTLARIVDEQGNYTEGTKGLSMFFLKVRDESGRLNNLEVQRLKDKLGTRQLPTAELLLDGVKAVRVTEAGRGVAGISSMLTITRLHNTLSAASAARRTLQLARDYSHKRRAFGNVIKDYPLHVKTLASMEVEARGATLLTLELARLLGQQECGDDGPTELFRLLTPVAKLYTAKQAVAVASEGLECFGGAGYLEDTGLPMLLRDAQVLPIWEGTTNILSLDVLRALVKSRGACLEAVHGEVTRRLQECTRRPELEASREKLGRAVNELVGFASRQQPLLQLAARDFAYSLARVYIGMLMTEQADWAGASQADILAANRWCCQDLVPMVTNMKNGCYDASGIMAESDLVFDGYTPNAKL